MQRTQRNLSPKVRRCETPKWIAFALGLSNNIVAIALFSGKPTIERRTHRSHSRKSDGPIREIEAFRGWSSRNLKGREERSMEHNFPECLKCQTGVLVPLSDYGRDGASIRYKAWVCTNPECGFHLRIDNGEVTIGRDIAKSYK